MTNPPQEEGKRVKYIQVMSVILSKTFGAQITVQIRKSISKMSISLFSFVPEVLFFFPPSKLPFSMLFSLLLVSTWSAGATNNHNNINKNDDNNNNNRIRSKTAGTSAPDTLAVLNSILKHPRHFELEEELHCDRMVERIGEKERRVRELDASDNLQGTWVSAE